LDEINGKTVYFFKFVDKFSGLPVILFANFYNSSDS